MCFTKKLTIEEGDAEKQVSMLRSHAVFNVAQIDGLPARIAAEEELPGPLPENKPRASSKAPALTSATAAAGPALSLHST